MDELAAEAKKKQAKTLGRRKVGGDLLRAVLPGPKAKEDKMVEEDKEKEKKGSRKNMGRSSRKSKKKKSSERTRRSKEAAERNRKTEERRAQETKELLQLRAQIEEINKEKGDGSPQVDRNM